MTNIWIIISALYAAGAVATAFWNLSMIVGPVKYPLSVLRNAVFWPVFVPTLLRSTGDENSVRQTGVAQKVSQE